MYECSRGPDGKVSNIHRLSGGFVPLDPGNRDYQDFLKWNEKQEVPLDLSDKEPEPLPVDQDTETLKVLTEKPYDKWAQDDIAQALSILIKRSIP